MSIEGRPQLPLWLLGASALLFVLKLYFAANLDLFGDGAFYWLESRNLAFAYSDLPPATAWVIRAGVTLFGDNPVGVRFFFISVAALPPLLVWYWAHSLFSRTEANRAAALTLAIPLATSLGVLAVPDALQVTVGLGAFMAFERATREGAGALRHWILVGVLVGAGFTIHYRFAIVPLGMAVYLLTAKAGLARLLQRGPWLAALVALPGLAPIVWFNLSHNLAGLSFQFVDRHPWQYHPGGVAFWRDQWLATTPLLYPALVAVALLGLRARSAGNDRPYLLALFGLTHILVYGLASPFMDQQRTNVHWPLLGYLPLAILVAHWVTRYWPQRSRLILGALVGTGAAGGLLLVTSLALMTVYERLPPDLRAPLVSKLSGHAEFASEVARHPDLAGSQDAYVILDQYYLAAQLKLHLGEARRIFLLPEEKAVRDGRALQLALWKMAWDDIPRDSPALLVIERTAWSDNEYNTLFDAVCTRFDHVTPTGEFRQFDGERLFRVFALRRGGGGSTRPGHVSPLCRPASRLYVDRGFPKAFDVVTGPMVTTGWAYQDDGGVGQIRLLIDGQPRATARYGLDRPDVQAFFTDSADPNHPHVGFDLSWSTAGLGPGVHSAGLEVTSANGHVVVHWVRPFRVP